MAARLYCFGESGNSYKAALAMELAGFEWEPVFVDFFNGEARSEEFRRLNPMGEAPVLEVGDLVLSQSGAIQDYVVHVTGKLGGGTDAERREILRWQFWDNHKNSLEADPPSPISPVADISITRSPSASTAATGHRSMPGSTGFRRLTAGSIPMT